MRGRLVLLLLCMGARPGLALDLPATGDVLRLRDASADRRSILFRATIEGIDPTSLGDPRLGGATLEVRGHGAADGSSEKIALDAARWRGLGDPPGSRGYRWTDPTRSLGVASVLLRRQNGGGRLAMRGGGASWSYAVDAPQVGPIDLRLEIGANVYCARFVELERNERGRVIARDALAPPDCAVCGDGMATGFEECDDGNTAGGDGCSATCQLEDATAVCAGVPATAGTTLDKVLVASGLTKPVYLTAPPLDPRRLFVVEHRGTIRVIRDGVLLPTPFLDLSGQISVGIEQGALSLAFDPDYETNGWVYVSYTAPTSTFSGPCAVASPGGGDNVIARYHVGTDPDVADVASATVLVTVDQSTPTHNGGLVTFGPDGALYASIGDGGGIGDPCEAAQNDLSPLGKLLRLDVSGPFPIDPVAAIWAKGLRNPWRFGFDRATGDLYVGDVGQNTWEEVSWVPAPVPANVNFQWDQMEGRHCYEPASGCDPSGTPPVLEYAHAQGCSVTAGYVYRGCALPDLRGRFFYSDYCDPTIRSFAGVAGGDAQSLATHPVLAPGLDAVVSFGEDARGEIYIVDFGDIPGTPGRGEIWRIVPGG